MIIIQTHWKNEKEGKIMIHVKNTTNNTGVTISGDFHDLDALYESLHKIVGTEGEWVNYESARLRVLGVCYDIRHALMGNREVSFVDNGLDSDKMKWLSIVANEKNVYYSFNTYWPEILFVTMALNDFVWLYAKKQAKSSYDVMFDYRNIWDSTIATVRGFQAAIADCIKETIPETSINRVLKLMNGSYIWFDHYATQYIDELNIKFIEMTPEKRLKNITVMAKRIAEQGDRYQDVKAAVMEAARDYNCKITEIGHLGEYPEKIEW